MHLYDRRLARGYKRGMARRVARTGRLSALNRLTGGTTLKVLGCGLMLLASGCQAIRPTSSNSHACPDIDGSRTRHRRSTRTRAFGEYWATTVRSGHCVQTAYCATADPGLF
jgi:hypothetical protein